MKKNKITFHTTITVEETKQKDLDDLILNILQTNPKMLIWDFMEEIKKHYPELSYDEICQRTLDLQKK